VPTQRTTGTWLKETNKETKISRYDETKKRYLKETSKETEISRYDESVKSI
jgi:hypothetical protein